MKFEKYLNEKKYKATMPELIKFLKKGISSDDSVINDMALALRSYLENSSGTVFLTGNRKTLMDELWYRVGGTTLKTSERFIPEFVKRLKKNFYSLEKKYFNKRFVLVDKGKYKRVMEMKFKKYLDEAKKFVAGYETHNKKIGVSMYKTGKGMSGDFSMTITDLKSGKTEEKEFSSQKEMKNYWQKIHKANLK